MLQSQNNTEMESLQKNRRVLVHRCSSKAPEGYNSSSVAFWVGRLQCSLWSPHFLKIMILLKAIGKCRCSAEVSAVLIMGIWSILHVSWVLLKRRLPASSTRLSYECWDALLTPCSKQEVQQTMVWDCALCQGSSNSNQKPS